MSYPYVPGYDNATGYDFQKGVYALNAFFDSTFRQTDANAFGKDSMRAFFLMSDLPNRLMQLNTIVTNLLIFEMHPILKEILPLVPTTDMEFRNMVVTYENALLEHRPEQAPSRQLREYSTVNVGKMHRYGRGAFFTVDVANTSEGRIMISAKMYQFIAIAQKSFAMEALHTLLIGSNVNSAGSFEQQFNSKYQYLEMIRLEIDEFCLGNKKQNGLMQLTTQGAKLIEQKTGKPATHFILPPLKASAVLKSNPMYTQHFLAGQGGPDRFNMPLTPDQMLHGIRLMEAPDYSQYANQTQQVSMQNRATIGRYEPIQYTEYSGDKTTIPSTYIFDIGYSDYVRVGLEDAFVASERFVKVTRSDVWKFNLPAFQKWFRENPNEEDSFLDYDDPREKFLHGFLFEDGQQRLVTDARVQDLAAHTVTDWLKKQVPGYNETEGECLLFGAMTMRPFESYLTDSGIIVRGGRELGMVGHSPDLIEMGKNVANGTQVLEYSVFAGGFVADWRYVHILPNVFYSKTLYGGNTLFLDSAANKKLSQNKFKFVSPETPCMYANLFPRLKRNKNTGMFSPRFADSPNVIFLHGKSPFYAAGENNEESYPGSSYCSFYWNWNEAEPKISKRDNSPIATYMCPGSYKIMAPTGLMNLIAGRTHHGPKEDCNSREVRNKGLSVVE